MNCAMLFSMIMQISILSFTTNSGKMIVSLTFKGCISLIVGACKSILKPSWFPFFIKYALGKLYSFLDFCNLNERLCQSAPPVFPWSWHAEHELVSKAKHSIICMQSSIFTQL